MRSYEFSERALADLANASEWYDGLRAGLGRQFVDAVVAAIRIARERPTSCPLVRNGVRAVRCKRFPYRVYFEAHDDRIDVLAVYHTARNTRRWDDPNRP
jgi:plasmid stabilization system protein ParE